MDPAQNRAGMRSITDSRGISCVLLARGNFVVREKD